MRRTLLGLSIGSVLLASCAKQPATTSVVTRDQAPPPEVIPTDEVTPRLPRPPRPTPPPEPLGPDATAPPPVRPGDDPKSGRLRPDTGRVVSELADIHFDFDRYEHFMHAASMVPDARFEAGKTAWKIVDGNSAHHYREHGDQIRAWRKSRDV